MRMMRMRKMRMRMILRGMRMRTKFPAKKTAKIGKKSLKNEDTSNCKELFYSFINDVIESAKGTGVENPVPLK